jgi:predicted ribosomally synthesized peptide with SipW-like signal peptide
MKKIIGLSLALMMVVGMIGVATFAHFTDNETSSGNQMVAGTLDLKVSNDGITYSDGVSQTLYATNMSPGATVSNNTFTLKNAGNTNGATMDIVFSYANSDGTPNTVPMTANQTAAVIEVTTLTYGGTDLLTTLPLIDTNGNVYIDVLDLTSAPNVTRLTGLSGLDAGVSKVFAISVQLRSETGNSFQSDGIDMTMTFTLKQQ